MIETDSLTVYQRIEEFGVYIYFVVYRFKKGKGLRKEVPKFTPKGGELGSSGLLKFEWKKLHTDVVTGLY